MRYAPILLILLAALFFSGCIAQKEVASAQKEKLANAEEIDIDGDGAWDYAIYTFAPVKIDSEGITVERRLFVSAEKATSFSSFNALTDYNISEINNEFEEFVELKEAAAKDCSNSLGLISAICVEPKTCAKLCSSSSSKCSNIASKHESVLGDSIKSFVKNNDEVSNGIYQVRKDLLTLKSTDPETKRAELANKLMGIIARVSSINSGLVTAHPNTQLCQHDDYGVYKLSGIFDALGIYTKQPVNYHYISTVDIKVVSNESGAQWQPKKLAVSDVLTSAGVSADAISSPQLDPQYKMLSIESGDQNISLIWDSVDPYPKGASMLVFAFSSKNLPATFLTDLKTPTVTVKTVDMAAALPTIMFYETALKLSKHPLFALGFSISLTLILLLLVYNILVIVYYIATALTAGEKITTGIRRAVAKTRLQWKSDIILSIVLLAVGFLSLFNLTTPPQAAMTIFEVLDYLLHLTDYISLIGTLCIMFGFFIFYLAIENKLKVSFLEREYGQKIKEEKDLFLANIAQLKNKLGELKNTADLLTAEGVNVSREYEFVDDYTPERIEKLGKKADQYSKQAVENSLFEVDGALQRLNEKKKLIIDNWQKWSESISSALAQSDEVHINALLGVPASLRAWALTKYIKEHQQEGLVYEADMLRRRYVQPDKVVKDMLQKGLLTGAVLIKDGKILSVNVEKGSTTVTSVLALKLINHTLSTVKKLGQHSYSTLAAVGERLVLVLIRHQAVDAVLFIEKEKFKDAVEEWKAKLKLIEKQ